MNGTHDWRIRLLLTVGFLFIVFFGMTRSAHAQGIVRGDGVPTGTTIDGDVFLTGDDIVINGTVLGDVLAIGRTVTVNGIVDGSLVALAEKVTVSGQVEGSTYTAALTYKVDDPGTVTRSAYFTGASLFTEPDSRIGRDLAFAALGSNMAGSVGGDVQATTGLEIVNQGLVLIEDALGVFGVEVDFSSIRLGQGGAEASSEAIPMITFAGLKIPNGLAQSQPGRYASPANRPVGQEQEPEVEEETDTEGSAGDWFLKRLLQLVQFLIVGGLAIWIMPRRFDRWSDRLQARPGGSILFGFMGVITGYIGVGLLLILVVAIGIGLAIIKLGALSFASIMLGLSSTWLLFSLFVIVILFISKVIVSYVGGYLILNRIYPRANRHRFWPLLLGLVLFILIWSIPFLGWAFGLLVTIAGMGAFLLAFSRSRPADDKQLAIEEEE